jgi:hypothetical protein
MNMRMHLDEYLSKFLNWLWVMLGLLLLFIASGYWLAGLLSTKPASYPLSTSALDWAPLFSETTTTKGSTENNHSTWRLVGTVKNPAGISYALVARDKKTQLLAVGQKADDLTLKSISSKQAVFTQNKNEELVLYLDKKPLVSSSSASMSTNIGTHMSNNTCLAALPKGTHGISEGMLKAFAQTPANLSAMFFEKNGQLTIKNLSGLGSVLQVEDGDVMLTANGQGLSNAQSVLALVIQPLLAGKPVTVVGVRGGAAKNWLYQCTV